MNVPQPPSAASNRKYSPAISSPLQIPSFFRVLPISIRWWRRSRSRTHLDWIGPVHYKFPLSSQSPFVISPWGRINQGWRAAFHPTNLFFDLFPFKFSITKIANRGHFLNCLPHILMITHFWMDSIVLSNLFFLYSRCRGTNQLSKSCFVVVI